MDMFDVVVLGAGPAGLSAGISSCKNGANTLIIEREDRPGGILKQCIHDGFGIIRFKQRLSGPEYAEKYIKMARDLKIPILTSTFVLNIKKEHDIFYISLINSKQGTFTIKSKTLILANGCRERTAKQIAIHGSRPAGVFTAGTAQYFVNIMGYLPCKRCVILGSGDIGLIMARRLTLEGAKVIGVYEAKQSPSGLSRNIAQCLDDYSIPLHLSHTITRVFGDDRVERVEVCKVDGNMKPVPGTEEVIECDGVILSVGLIPENEIAESLNIGIDAFTKGPYVDQDLMTLLDGVFCCGNALHVNDLVDYVSESGDMAGYSAAVYSRSMSKRNMIKINISADHFLYSVPQYINRQSQNKKIILHFRSRDIREKAAVVITCMDKILLYKEFMHLKPPEMERIELDISEIDLGSAECLNINMLEE